MDPWKRPSYCAALRVNVLFCVLFCAVVFTGVSNASDFELITDRYVEYLIDRHVDSPVDIQLADSLGEDGRWDDVEYTSDRRSDWPAIIHLSRTKQLALMSRAELASPVEKTLIRNAAIRAAKSWFSLRANGSLPLPPNNYWRVWGEPRIARDCLLLLSDEVDEGTRESMVRTLKRVELRDKGANLMGQADVVMHLGAYTRDYKVVAAAAQRIASEIKITQGDGIQSDYSFRQHGPRLQSFHYGKSYFEIAVRLAWQLRGTRWAISPRRIGLLSDFALEGLRWMSRGEATPPSTLDRAASRQGALRSADVSRELDLLAALSPRRKELQLYSQSFQTGRNYPIGHRYFPESDFVTYHRPTFSFFLKTVSADTRLSESLNGENLLGDFMNWGDHYLIRDGREYAELQPVWDWRRLPGLTVGEGVGGRSFVDLRRMSGTISTDVNGVTALEGRLSGKRGTKLVQFRKSWFFHGDRMIALVSGLKFRGATGGQLTTSVEQCRLRGDIKVALRETKVQTIKRESTQLLEGVRWIHHNDVAYVPIGSSKLRVSAESQSGSWRRVNKKYSSSPVSEPVFSLAFEHRQDEPAEAFGYVVVPSIDAVEVEQTVNGRQWTISSNDSGCQAIWFDDQNWMATFFEAGELSMSETVQVTVDSPCLLLFREGVLHISKILPKTQSISVDVTGFGPRSVRFLPGQTKRRLRS